MGFVAQEKEYPTRCVHLGLQFRTSNLDPVETSTTKFSPSGLLFSTEGGGNYSGSLHTNSPKMRGKSIVPVILRVLVLADIS